MSKTYITLSDTSTLGYAIVDVLDDGTTRTQDIVERFPDHKDPNTLWYVLPTNEANRKFINNRVIRDGLVIKYRETRHLDKTGTSKTNTTVDKLTEYMSDEDKATMARILADAKKRMDAYYNDPVVKLQLELERAKKAYEAKLQALNEAKAAKATTEPKATEPKAEPKADKKATNKKSSK